ncbi:hypothetical protein TRAPUB_1196 [Trametes pubescens]|uniref:Uncharacterized protein n=1 Tax=Trametes pubescens TaxID=154538 RepID=A0A1M2VK22_TRAPU|nr:hypothetical protein TRAPUB_1196 [Trametes pubescens]
MSPTKYPRQPGRTSSVGSEMLPRAPDLLRLCYRSPTRKGASSSSAGDRIDGLEHALHTFQISGHASRTL